jgi:4-hydroxybenzoate polyprenyltransferase
MSFRTTPLGSIIRHHIVLIAMLACVTFGWIITGRYFPWLALIVGVDWFFINIFNRITDAKEDVTNAVPGAEEVAVARRWLEPAAFGALAISFVVTQWAYPTLWPWRVAVQIVGLAYSYRLVPTPSGPKRLKEFYLIKNTGSAALFVVTCIIYPWQASGAPSIFPLGGIVALAVFFPLYELSYEIIYDLRDLPGDRAEGIPTFPVAHGEVVSVQIIHGLLVASVATLLGGFGLGVLGVRELLMLVAPGLQWLLLRRWLKRGIVHEDCIRLTHIGSALLVVFLVGTYVWVQVGLPGNIFVR